MRAVKSESRERVEREETVEQLFNEHHLQVYRAAYRLTGNPADAEDAVQTVFLRISRNPPATGGRNWAGYLHRSAVNAALDILRSRRRQMLPLGEVEIEASSPDSDPEGATRVRELEARLRKALVEERRRPAEIFVLRHLEGLSNSEIANLLGTSRGVVAVTLHRVRRRLQKVLRSES